MAVLRCVCRCGGRQRRLERGGLLHPLFAVLVKLQSFLSSTVKHSVKSTIIIVCFLFQLFSIWYAGLPLDVLLCIVVTDMLVSVLSGIRPCRCLIMFQAFGSI